MFVALIVFSYGCTIGDKKKILPIGKKLHYYPVMTYDDAIAYFGGRQYRLANALGVTAPTVSQWKGVIPAQYQFQIEVLSNRALKVDPQLIPEALRPQAA